MQEEGEGLHATEVDSSGGPTPSPSRESKIDAAQTSRDASRAEASGDTPDVHAESEKSWNAQRANPHATEVDSSKWNPSSSPARDANMDLVHSSSAEPSGDMEDVHFEQLFSYNRDLDAQEAAVHMKQLVCYNRDLDAQEALGFDALDRRYPHLDSHQRTWVLLNLTEAMGSPRPVEYLRGGKDFPRSMFPRRARLLSHLCCRSSPTTGVEEASPSNAEESSTILAPADAYATAPRIDAEANEDVLADEGE